MSQATIGGQMVGTAFHVPGEATGYQMLATDLNGDGTIDFFRLADGPDSAYRNVGTRYNPVWQADASLLFPGVTEKLRYALPSDEDGDGDLDALLVTRDSQYSVWRAMREGTRQSPEWRLEDAPLAGVPLPAGGIYGGPPVVALADLDGDGRPELIAAAMTRQVGAPGGYVLRIFTSERTACPEGACWPAATPLFTASHPGMVLSSATTFAAIQLVDLDADGDADLVLSGMMTSGEGTFPGFCVIRNQGTPGLPAWGTARFTFRDEGHPDLLGLADQDTRSFAFADIDADGDFDLFTYNGFFRNAGNAAAAVFPEQGEPGFFGIQHGQLSRPVIEDVNGDTRPDLLISHVREESFNANVMLYAGAGTAFSQAFAHGAYVPLGWPFLNHWTPCLRFADLEADGVRDAWLGGKEGLLRGERSGAAPPPYWAAAATNGVPPLLAGLDCSNGFDWGDVDGDLRLDFIRATGAGGLELYSDPAGTGFALRTNDLGRLRAALPAGTLCSPVWRDVDGDGLPDLAALRLSTSATGELVVAWGTPAGLSDPEVVFAFARGGGDSIDLADVDGDGDADLFAGARYGGVQHFLNPQPHLLFARDRLRVTTGQTVDLAPTNATGAVSWRFVRNATGAALDPATGRYTAGPAEDFDTVEAVDASGRRGRVHLSAVSPQGLSTTGHALLVAGSKAATDPVWAATDHMARRANEVLGLKGFARENITHLSFDPERDLDGNGLLDDIDGPASVAAIAAAFTGFASGSERLLVHLADHGSGTPTNAFMRLSPSEQLSASEFKGMLDAYQTATSNEVTVVMDFCYAGDFARRLADPAFTNRILIASCAGNELAYFVARGLVSYSDVFFNALLAGADIRGAHQTARGAMSTYQLAQLDDNGDGVADPDVDGTLAETRTVGATRTAGRDLPQIGGISPNQEVDRDQPALIWAENVTGPYPIREVWAVVIPPDGTPDAAGGDPVVDLPEIPLVFNPQTGRHEAELRGLSQPGLHQVIFLARDVWDSVSFPRQSFLFQAGYTEKAVLAYTGEPGEPPAVVAGEVFRALTARGIAPAQLHVLAAGPADLDHDGLADEDAPPTLAALEHAVTAWAADADKLTVCLVGRGTNGLFQLDAPLPHAGLDAWLDAYQQAGTGRVAVVVLDHDGAAETFPANAASNRVVIASTASGRPAVLEPGASFSGFFFSDILVGRPVGEAARNARVAVRRFSGNLRQKVHLSDDGNGIPNQKTNDLAFARTVRIGAAFLTGDDLPGIGAVTPPLALTNETSVLLWAADVTDADGISNVVVRVSAPTNSLAGLSRVISLAHVPARGRHEALVTGFTERGVHTLTFQATDNTGRVSAAAQSAVTKFDPVLLPQPAALLPDAHEPDDTPAQAGYTDLAALRAHSLHTTGDEDWVRFFATSNQVYDVETLHLSPGLDTRIELYRQLPDGSAELLDTVDENGPGEGELTGLDFPADGFYLVRVRHADDTPAVPGSYLLGIHVPAGYVGINVVVTETSGTSFLAGALVRVLRPNGQELARATSTSTRQVEFPKLPADNYVVEVQPPGGYTPYFDPSNPARIPENPAAPEGNPRQIGAQQFSTIAYGGNTFTSYVLAGFFFHPSAVVTGRVTDAATGLPVAAARVELLHPADGTLRFDRYYWADYGTPWLSTAAGEFPSTLRVPPAAAYRLRVRGAGYADYTLDLANVARGQVRSLGALPLIPLLGGNGIPDPYELAFGVETNANPAADVDGDGLNLAEEYTAGTDPLSALDRLALLPAAVLTSGTPGRITLSWPAQPGRHYRVEENRDFPQGEWIPLTPLQPCGPAARVMTWASDLPGASPGAVYRIRVVLPASP